MPLTLDQSQEIEADCFEPDDHIDFVVSVGGFEKLPPSYLESWQTGAEGFEPRFDVRLELLRGQVERIDI